eukprot:TRINITY_DN16760_c0_g1_i1.p1 TRINITY_DN16760_c0_g1~~TRINITY_DN16760_c0_g1_i1.p1  ORF type:complete len:137 (-),score=1.50 TRINITY_DN16760_c0_g1_i1:355-765(-)
MVDDGRGFARACDGPMWSNYLALNMAVPHENYAVSGATTGIGLVFDGTEHSGGILWQANRVPANLPDIDETLFTIWGGENDILPKQGEPGAESLDWPALIAGVIANIITSMSQLKAKGARHIMVSRVPVSCLLGNL